MKNSISIRKYFFILIAPTAIVFSILVVSLLLVNDFRVTEASRLESQKLIFQSFLYSIRQPLIQGSFVEARVRSKEMLNNKQINCIDIKTPETNIRECGLNGSGLKTNLLNERLLFSESSTEAFADVSITFDNSDLLKHVWIQGLKALTIFMALGVLLYGALSIAFKLVRRELEEVVKSSHSGETSNYIFKITEFEYLSRRIAENIIFAQEVAVSKAALGLATQVAHDIRSPISTLNLVSSSLKEVSEEKRELISFASQRINDIANQLLEKSKLGLIKYDQQNDVIHCNALAPVVDSLVAEKRAQYIRCQKININLDISNCLNVLCYFNKTELLRCLSNIINNSVESFEQGSGKINVQLTQTLNEAVITVQDDGTGIPQKILVKLNEGHFISHGKEFGSGLGLSHARKAVESFGGRLHFESEQGVGTKVSIFLRKLI